MNVFKKTVTLAAAVSLVCLFSAGAMAANKLIVKDSTGATDMFVVTDAGLIGSGTNSPIAAFQAKGNTYPATQIVAHWNGVNAGIDSRYAGGGFMGLYNGNSNALPLLNNRLGYFLFGSANGTGKLVGAGLNFNAEQNWTTLSIPAYISFMTAPVNSVNMTERVRITSAGNVGINTTAPSQKLDISGGFRLNSAGAAPTCNAANRGTFWITQGTTDNLQLCGQVSGGYAWRNVTLN